MKRNEPHSYPDELITAYLNEELPADRREELEKWVSADPAHKRYLYEMTEIWLASTAALGNSRSARLPLQARQCRLVFPGRGYARRYLGSVGEQR